MKQQWAKNGIVGTAGEEMPIKKNQLVQDRQRRVGSPKARGQNPSRSEQPDSIKHARRSSNTRVQREHMELRQWKLKGKHAVLEKG